jgi:hypothetical protein
MKLLIFIFLFTAHHVWAHIPEEGRVTAVLGPYIYNTPISHSNPSYEIPYRVGVGLTVEGDLDKHGGIEAGLFYLNKMYSRQQGAQEDVEIIKRMYATMGYRYWVSKRGSIALAFASSYSMGDAVSVHSTSTNPLYIATTASKKTEYAIDLSFQREFWRRGRSAWVADARYAFSMNNKDDEDADMYGLLIGFKYDVQGEPPPEPKVPAAK